MERESVVFTSMGALVPLEGPHLLGIPKDFAICDLDRLFFCRC